MHYKFTTDQELFDAFLEAARKNPSRSLASKDGIQTCAYRDGKGGACLIGRFIPDDKYSPQLEGKTVFNENVREAAGIPKKLEKLATELQRIHDWYPPVVWEKQFEKVAERFRLFYNPLVDTNKENPNA